MLAKIKEFLFGKPSIPEAPYKVEAPAPETKVESAPVVDTKVEVVPAGTEATIAAPAPKVPAKPKAEPKAEPKPKAAPKPRAPAKPKAAK